MRISVALVAMLVAASGWSLSVKPAQSDSRQTNQTRPAEVPPIFRPFYQGFILLDQEPAVRAALPYERISLERSGGMVIPAGWFRVTLARNGDAELWADKGSPFDRIGDYVGRVDIFSFGKLCHLIHSIGFEQLSARYDARLSDVQIMTVTIATRAGL
jgi:hypothetical protein